MGRTSMWNISARSIRSSNGLISSLVSLEKAIFCYYSIFIKANFGHP